MNTLKYWPVLGLAFFISNLQALEFKSGSHSLKLEWVYDNKYEDKVWGFDFLNNSTLIFNESSGSTKILNLKTKKVKNTKINYKNLLPKGQGGLLDIKVIGEDTYVSYSYLDKASSKTTTALSQLDLKNSSSKIIYLTKAYSNNKHHYGSRITANKSHLFLTVGDRGERFKAQKDTDHNGKILQFSLKDLSTPVIYSKGHRNPQGITFTPNTDKLLNGEFGPQGGDEINHVLKGNNYGWPLITYGEEYGGGKIGTKSQSGLVQPIHYWTPSISFSGINFYTGDKILDWKNNLFLACLGSQQLVRLRLNDDYTKVLKEEKLLKNLNERIRMVRMGPDQDLYISTDSGKIGKISLIK